MNKVTLERHAAAMREAIAETLNALRIDGTCRLCSSRSGEAHRDGCAAWPIILARAEYALADEGDALL
jgi:hypothetical protein